MDEQGSNERANPRRMTYEDNPETANPRGSVGQTLTRPRNSENSEYVSPLRAAKMALDEEVKNCHDLVSAYQEKLNRFVDPTLVKRSQDRNGLKESSAAEDPELSQEAAFLWSQVSMVRQLRDRLSQLSNSLDLG